MRRWAPALFWAGLLFLASSIPGSSLPSPGILHLDKVAHAAAYALLAYLVARARGTTDGRSLAIGAMLAALYGVSDEIHQRFTPGRDADALDAVANAVGAAAGVGGWALCRYWEQMRAKA